MNEIVTAIGPLLARELAAASVIAATAPDPWRTQDISAALQDGRRVLLAARSSICGGEALDGFICLRILAGEAELEMLAVAPAARRQGTGRALVTAGLIASQKAGATRCLLELRAGNLAALGLYESLGFTLLARRPAMYANPREDGLCMELDLE